MIPTAHVLGHEEQLLVECQNGFLLLPEVCQAFKTMQKAAAQDDIDLQIVSSYRSFERQSQIWQNKWSGKAVLLDANEQPLETATLSSQEKMLAILTWSALPGASRHHWGTDLDVYDKKAVEECKDDFQLVCGEYDQGPCSNLNAWLSEHAEEFGFDRPYAKYKGGVAREPWHISYSASAKKMSALMSEQLLVEALKNSDILGLETILEWMPKLYQRFVLNRGIK
jgi:LAS superfamily LD-carboxypeptidase LdcB